MRWQGFDKGREGVLARDKWFAILEIISRHEGEDHTDLRSPIFSELQQKFPRDSWTGEHGDRSFFRDYAAAWVGTGVLAPMVETGQRFELTARGRHLVGHPEQLEEYFRQVLDAYSESIEVNGRSLTWSPVEIISAVLRSRHQIDLSDLEYEAAKLATACYPELDLVSASAATNQRRFRSYLLVMQNAGAIQRYSRSVQVIDPEYLESMTRPRVSWTADVLDELDLVELNADDRRRSEREAVVREGQEQFSREVKSAYGNQCCVTLTAETGVLEAAHIVPYMGRHSNSVRNGLCLAVDIHRLFDKNLLGIRPDTLIVEFAESVFDQRYAPLEGRQLRLPISSALQPSREALARRYGQFMDFH
ncbi:HNH endonuclease [Pseudarthrobacter enclensis]|uniref:HNH endonuclease n=1 Tax=Pseudarthrobacter enclensis TaxID=993070 RepID=UPI0036A64A65